VAISCVIRYSTGTGLRRVVKRIYRLVQVFRRAIAACCDQQSALLHYSCWVLPIKAQGTILGYSNGKAGQKLLRNRQSPRVLAESGSLTADRLSPVIRTFSRSRCVKRHNPHEFKHRNFFRKTIVAPGALPHQHRASCSSSREKKRIVCHGSNISLALAAVFLGGPLARWHLGDRCRLLLALWLQANEKNDPFGHLA